VSELLNCPFCGSRAVKAFNAIVCDAPTVQCGAQMIVVGSFAESVHKWNRRTEGKAAKGGPPSSPRGKTERKPPRTKKSPT
jgi:hypothetical protein